jgi:hypothetical protein
MRPISIALVLSLALAPAALAATTTPTSSGGKGCAAGGGHAGGGGGGGHIHGVHLGVGHHLGSGPSGVHRSSCNSPSNQANGETAGQTNGQASFQNNGLTSAPTQGQAPQPVHVAKLGHAGGHAHVHAAKPG